jgi:hypothetical protein
LLPHSKGFATAFDKLGWLYMLKDSNFSAFCNWPQFIRNILESKGFEKGRTWRFTPPLYSIECDFGTQICADFHGSESVKIRANPRPQTEVNCFCS